VRSGKYIILTADPIKKEQRVSVTVLAFLLLSPKQTKTHRSRDK
jgi:hypothetical protein